MQSFIIKARPNRSAGKFIQYWNKLIFAVFATLFLVSPSTVSAQDGSEEVKYLSDPLTTIGDNQSYSYKILTDNLNDLLDITATQLPAWLSLMKDAGGEVSSLAGNGFGYQDGAGSEARFFGFQGIVTGTDGNLYITDTNNNRIRKVTPDGEVSTFAGNGLQQTVDGPALQASFYGPVGIVQDAAGNFYISEQENSVIRKIDTQGQVTTFAGSGTRGDVNGTGTAASFSILRAMTIDDAGNLYVIDSGNNKIKKITPEGVVTTLAGSGEEGSANGTGAEATFAQLYSGDILVGNDGNIYVTSNFSAVRKITPEGVVTTFAGSNTSPGFQDGTGTAARFHVPVGLAMDRKGNLYVADQVNGSIRKITPEAVVTTFVGNGNSAIQDGPVAQATFNLPHTLTIGPQGNFYVLENNTLEIKKISVPTAELKGSPIDQVGTHQVSLQIGDGSRTGSVQSFSIEVTDNTPPTFLSPKEVVVQENVTGSIYEARIEDNNSNATTSLSFASTFDFDLFEINEGQISFKQSPDFENPLDADGDNRYLVEIEAGDGLNSVREIVAIQVTNDLLEDAINSPPSISSNPLTEVREADQYEYIIKTEDADVQKVTITASQLPSWLNLEKAQAHEVSTVAGNGSSFSQDGTGANASFGNLNDLVVDSKGNIFVADRLSHVIRKVTPDGTVSLFAGAYWNPGLIDGPWWQARFSTPTGITIDGADNLYVMDAGTYSAQGLSNVALRKITPNGDVSTVAGGAEVGYVDGAISEARFEAPTQLRRDRFGNFYVFDKQRIRRIGTDGQVTTVAGSGQFGQNNGTGTEAQFLNVSGLAIDSDGNVYTASGTRVRKVTPEGVVTDFIGTTESGYQDGVGSDARFGNISSITFDNDGNLLIGDQTNSRIRKVTPTLEVTTIAGNGELTFNDGPGLEAAFFNPWSLDVDRSDRIIVADLQNYRIRAISPFYGLTGDPAGQVGQHQVTLTATDEAGAFATQSFTIDVLETPVFTSPDEVSFEENSTATAYTALATLTDPDAEITYGLSEKLDYELFTINVQTGEVNFKEAPDFDNPKNTFFNNEYEIEVEASYNSSNAQKRVVISVTNVSDEAPVFESLPQTQVFEGDTYSYNIAVSDISGEAVTVSADALPDWLSLQNAAERQVSTFAGSGLRAYVDGQGTNAAFDGPSTLAIDRRDGTIYVSDGGNYRIRKISKHGDVTPFVGSGRQGSVDGIGTKASFNSVGPMVVDKQGNLYLTETSKIRKVTPDGVVTTLAGGNTQIFKDGTGVSAGFLNAHGIVIDSKGNLFVADGSSRRIRKVTMEGVVTTFAGNGSSGNDDGTGTEATFNNPFDLTIDAEDNLYVSDSWRIRKITPEAVVTTIAGNGNYGHLDGTGTEASFKSITHIAHDGKDLLYISDDARIRVMDANGLVQTLTGGDDYGYQDGNASSAQFGQILSFVIDNSGALIIADGTIDRIRRLSAPGQVLTGSSTGQTGTFSISLKATDTNGDQSTQDFDIEVLPAGSPYFVSDPVLEVNEGDSYVYEISAEHPQNAPVSLSATTLPSWLSLGTSERAVVSTVAGNGRSGNTDGPALEVPGVQTASFTSLNGLAVDKDGNVYIANANSHLIRKYSTDGTVSTFAGGGFGYADGTGTAALFASPSDLAIDSQGNLFVVDRNNYRIRKITPEGVVSTLAGSGVSQEVDGTGTGASFGWMLGIAVGPNDNIYVSDLATNSIRKITQEGVVTRFAGKGSQGTEDGDALSAGFTIPGKLTFDADGNLLVASYSRIRKISPEGQVTTIAGGLNIGFADGTGTEARFDSPGGLAVDSNGNIYVADTQNHRLRKITPDGVVTTVAGSASNGYADGVGENAAFNFIESLTIDNNNNLYLGDINYRLRKINFPIQALSGNTAGQVGNHDVVLKVDDPAGNFATQAFTIKVKDVTAPVFTSADQVTYAENANTVGQTLEADDTSEVTFSISNELDGALFQLLSGNLLFFINSPDFENPTDSDLNNEYQVKLIAEDAEGNQSEQTLRITVSDEPDTQPTITSGDAVTIPENAQGSIYTITATGGNNIIYRIGAINDGTQFVVNESTGEVTFKVAPDYDDPDDQNQDNVYQLQVQAWIGQLLDSKEILITVTDEPDAKPVFTSANNISIPEGTSGTIYTAEASDADSPFLTYGLGAGNDESLFSINENTGELRTLGFLDFEFPQDANQDNVYQLLLTVSDGNTEEVLALNLSVTNVNDNSPGFGSFPVTEVQEGTPYRYDLEIIDIDGGDNQIFIEKGASWVSLVEDQGNFSLQGDTDGHAGVYPFRIRITDGIGNQYQGWNLRVLGKISFTSSNNATVNENTTEVVYTATATGSDNIVFSLGNSGDESVFEINGAALSFKEAPDFENPKDTDLNNQYFVEIIAQDGADKTRQEVAIFVSDVSDEAIVFTSPGTVDYYENSVSLRAYTPVLADPAAFTLSMEASLDAQLFNFENGIVSFKEAPDFENPQDLDQDNEYSIRMLATDAAGQQVGKVVVIRLINASEEAAIITSYGGGDVANVSVIENSSPAFVLESTMEAGSNTESRPYMLFEKDFELFQYESSTQTISFKNPPDFENPLDANGDNVYELRIEARPGDCADCPLSRLDFQDLFITVTDEAEDRIKITSNGGAETGVVTMPERESLVTNVTLIGAVSENNLSYTISGTDAEDFTISANGELAFKTPADFEQPIDNDQDNVYLLKVAVTDGVTSDEQWLGIVVTDVNEFAAVITSNEGAEVANFNVVENSSPSFALEAMMEAGSNTTASVSMLFEKDFELFQYEHSTRTISFKSPPDFENPQDANGDNIYELRIEARPGDCADCPDFRLDFQDIFITVTDEIEDRIKITSNGGGDNATISLPEREILVGTVTITGAVPENPLNYTISGIDAGQFEFNEGGELIFLVAPDFEQPADDDLDNVYQISVEVTDGVTSDEQSLSIGITDVNEFAAVITSNGGGESAYLDVVENQAVVTTVEAMMEPGSNTTTRPYMLFEKDWSLFNYDAATGALTFKTPPDFENPLDANGDNVYELRIEARPGDCADCPDFRVDTQDLFVRVTDLPEGAASPVWTSPTSVQFLSGSNGVAYVATALHADPVVFGMGASDDVHLFDFSNGELRFNQIPDINNPIDNNGDNIYEIELLALAGPNFEAQARQNISIQVVEEIDTRPVFESDPVIKVSENETYRYLIEVSSPVQSAITLSLKEEIDWLTLTPASGVTGVLSGNPQGKIGPTQVELIATNAAGELTSQVFIIEVTDGTPPVITSATTASVEEGTAGVVYKVEAIDFSTLTYQFDTTFPDASLFSIDPFNGEIRFLQLPDYENPQDADIDNVYELSFSVTDDFGFSAQQNLEITVTDLAELGPVFTSPFQIDVISGTTGGIYRATVADDTGVTFSLGNEKDESFFLLTGADIAFITAPDVSQPRDADINNIYEVEIIASDGVNESRQTIEIRVVNQPAPPVFTSSTSASVAEGTPGTLFFVTASGASPHEFFFDTTYEDAAYFEINPQTGAVSFKQPLDYENPQDANGDNVYNLYVGVRGNNGEQANQELTVTVTDVVEVGPVFTSALLVEVPENTSTVVYVPTVDNPEGVTITTSNTKDEGLFRLFDNELTFLSPPDYEDPQDGDLNNDYELTFLATDAFDNVTSQVVIIRVIADNAGPQITSPINVNVVEGTPGPVYKAAATDANPPLTYLFDTTYEDANEFVLDSETGDITFIQLPDFDNPRDANSDNVYELGFSVSDARGNQSSLNITITVTELFEGNPKFTSPSEVSVNEGQLEQTVLHRVTALGESALRFSIDRSNQDAAYFNIDEVTGEISITQVLFHENPVDENGDSVYETVIIATDAAGQSTSQALSISILEVDETAPVFTSWFSTDFNENGTGVAYTIEATDDNPLTYGLGSVEDEGLFTVDGTSGEIRFVSPPDYENPVDADGDNNYRIQVIISDGINSISEEIYINVHNVEVSLTATVSAACIGDNNGTIDLSVSGGTAPYEISWNNGAITEDLDAIAPGTYTVTVTEASGETATGSFELTENPELSLSNLSTDVLCFGDASGTIDLTVTGGIAPYTYQWNNGATTEDLSALSDGNYTVTVTDAAGCTATAAITILEPAALSITANTSGETRSGTVDGSITLDLSGGTAPYTYSWSNGATTEDLTGLVAGTYTLTITDANGCTMSQAFVIGLSDITAPVFTVGAEQSIEENSQSVVTLTATDLAETVVFSISGGADASLFTITASNELQLLTAPDFENQADANLDNIYEVEISATDGANVATQTLQVQVTDLNDETPAFTITDNFSIEESTQEVVTLTATDADANSNLQYSISGGDDQSRFSIVNGVLSFATAPDFENPQDADGDNVYKVTVEVSDQLNTATKEVTVSVTDVDEIAPTVTITSSAGDQVFAPSFEVTITFSEAVTGFDMSDISFVNATGSNFSGSGTSYTLDVAAVVDGEVKLSIAAGVATDAANNGNEASNELVKTIEATNENPTAIGLSANEVNENEAAGFEIGSFSVTDVDLADDHTLSLVSGDGDDDNGSFQIIGKKLYTTTAFDFETKATLSIRVKATDLKGLSFTTSLGVNVLNLDEPELTVLVPDPANAGAFLTELTFADTRVNESMTGTLRVTNSGTDGQLTISGITFPTGFTIDQSQLNLEAGASTDLTVTFSPTEAIAYSGQLTISSNGGDKSVTVAGKGLANNPPVAVAPEQRVAYTLTEVITLSGYDPDGDAISFEIVTPPSLGTLTSTGNAGEYTFTPNALSPEVTYEDEIVFKVVETNGDLSSENATYPFSFQIPDQAHVISTLTVENIDSENKSFELTFEDEVFNDTYNFVLSYLDRTDVLNPVTRNVASVGLPKSALTINGNAASIQFTANIGDHPHLFAEGQVLVSAEVTTTNGFSDAESFVLTNDASGGSVVNSSAISEDGNFFLVGFTRSVPENEMITLDLIAVDFGGNSLMESTIEITKAPLKGEITNPVEARKSNNLAVWQVDYSSDTEVALLDSLQFSVLHPLREETIAVYGKIQVVEAPDAPQIADITDQELNEDEVLTLDLNITDPDSEFAVIVNSSDAANAPVSYNNGKLILSPVADFSGEVNISVLATETNKDRPLSDFMQFNVEIVPVNDAPVMNNIDDLSIDEDTNTSISLSATDVDADFPIFDYSVKLSNEAAATYVIDGESLTLTPAADFNGDIEVSVFADDRLGTANSLSEAETFTLTVNPVNDAPVVIANIPSQSVIEGFPSYTLDLSAYFEDNETAADNLIYSVDGTTNVNTSLSNEVLTISPVNGVYGIQIATITASDGELEVSQTITFITSEASGDVTLVNGPDNLELNEDFGQTTINLSNVFSYNADANASFTYTLSGQNSVNATVEGDVITISSKDNISGTDQLFVVATVDGKSAFTSFEIVVNPVNDEPELVIGLSDESTLEDEAFSKVISSSAFTDIDGDNLTYSATYDALWLSFDAGSRTFSGTPANEDVGEVAVTVKVEDPQGAFITDNFNITVENTNDNPTDITLSSTEIVENLTAGTQVGAFASADPDASDENFTYSLVSGEGATDNGSFSIEGGLLYTSAEFDFESKASYSIRVRTRDEFEGSYEEVFEIAIGNVNEQPTTFSLLSASINENTGDNSSLGGFDINDPDNDDTHTYSLVAGEGDDDNENFDIIDGALILRSSANFESKSSYSVRIRATDAGDLSLEQRFTITVNDLNEAPTALVLDNLQIDENESAGTVVGSLSTTDEDLDDSHTYAFVDGEGSDDNAAFELNGNQLQALSSFDFESKEQYLIRLKSTDSEGLSIESAFEITVNNVPEAILRVSEDQELPETGRGMSTSFQITIFNDGDGELEVTSLVYPEGFNGPTTGFTIAASSSADITVNFEPEEARLYEGDITVNTNAGTDLIGVRGLGTIVTSIDEDELSPKQINLYPNPASTVLNIDLSDITAPSLNIEIVNASGKPVFSRKDFREKQLALDVSAYQGGMYLIYFTDGKSSVYKKVIINK